MEVRYRIVVFYVFIDYHTFTCLVAWPWHAIDLEKSIYNFVNMNLGSLQRKQIERSQRACKGMKVANKGKQLKIHVYTAFSFETKYFPLRYE